MQENKRYAIVTGSSSGIGKAIAKKLSKENVCVFGLDIKESQDKQVNAFICDVSDEEQVIRVLKQIGEITNTIDFLVNCAGMLTIGRPLPIKDTPLKQWDAMLRINLKSVMLMVKYCYPFLKEAAGKGSIVNISSEQTLSPQYGFAPYMVSKAGINALTKCAALEFLEEKIRVNAIVLGTVRTNFLQSYTADENMIESMFQSKNREIPFGVASPERVADIILFLLSDASSYITGQTILVDGGQFLK